MVKRGPKPLRRVSMVWTPDLAYAIGLIATDGCLSNDGRHITLTSSDRQLLETFLDCLRLRHIKIGNIFGGYGHKSFRVQFGDVLLYKWLMAIGLTPNKSKTIGKLKIPDKFFFDFLRGCWDGDGSIYSYWDPRWHSSFMYYVSFVSASPIFLNWLRDTTAHLSSVDGRVTQARAVLQLRYAKSGSRQIVNRMFYRDGLPHLSRKFAKAQKIFTIDDNHS